MHTLQLDISESDAVLRDRLRVLTSLAPATRDPGETAATSQKLGRRSKTCHCWEVVMSSRHDNTL